MSAANKHNPDDFINAGIDLCAREGMRALTARKLARDLGIAPMVLYRHFDSLDHFRTAVWNACYARMDKVMWPEGNESGDYADVFRRACRAMANFGTDHPNLLWFMWDVHWTPERYGMESARRKALDSMMNLHRLGKESGAFRPDLNVYQSTLRTIYTMMGLTAFLITNIHTRIAAWEPDALLEDGIDHMLARMTLPKIRVGLEPSCATGGVDPSMVAWCSGNREVFGSESGGKSPFGEAAPDSLNNPGTEKTYPKCGDKTREEFIRAGVRVCNRDGMHALTARGIGQELDCTPMVLYRRFDSMEGFSAAVWNACFGLFNRSLWPLYDVPADCRTAIRRFVRAATVFNLDHPNLLWFMNATRWVPERYGLENQRLKGLNRLVDLHRRCVECGDRHPDADPLLASLRAVYTILGLSVFLNTSKEARIAEWDTDALLTDAVDLILEGYARSPR
ncbi:TetR/AcrR family transcriptional regulator [Candidatus Eisenbacteria bacterium]|uniref:TetR/AcrR family transcriptional regulator n=1 Tax=Eiseniibacteriota bacterium TaxID=2212470 RepID=A0ABV6YKJ7_UNCEI